MAVVVEFQGNVPILIEAADIAAGTGVRPSGVGLGSVHQKAASTFKDGLRMIGAIGDTVRGSLADAQVDEAEVKIGLKVSGTGQVVVAQSTVEGAIEVTFKVKVRD